MRTQCSRCDGYTDDPYHFIDPDETFEVNLCYFCNEDFQCFF